MDGRSFTCWNVRATPSAAMRLLRQPRDVVTEERDAAAVARSAPVRG